LKVVNEALVYERPTMENHGCRRKKRMRGWCEKWRGLEDYLYGVWVKKRLGSNKCSQKTW